MADIAIFRINYKSDFILTLNSDAGWMTPFCIKFWTGAPSQAYFAGYDGETYTHCAPVDGEPTKLRVQFDDHRLPIGDLKFQISYHFTVADFPTSVEDEVLNQASVIIEVDDAPAQVMLDFTGETAPEIEFSLPAYANEAQRIANEQARIAAEQQRIANEDARIQAEETRQYNEQQRIQHEEERVSEFARLKSESEAATTAANAAATLANEKAQLADDKATLAQAAATLANEKAQLAADKAALAQAAATLANEKAALAQQKATYAQTQGDYAKEQGDYAKAQGDTAQADHVRAEADHTTAADDHSRAEGDHTTAASDHSLAESDHTTAASDHSLAESDHTTAASDHSRAESDHTTSASDHTRAEADHTTAASDHETAASDHTRAESDHAAVEVYVDSLGAFDISSYHATGGELAKYADLTAALGTDGANIPEGIRKGGMSVKFVQSSDNKYVQYRLMSTAWSINEYDWQGVDTTLTAGNRNLVESIAILEKVFNINTNIPTWQVVSGQYINVNGVKANNSSLNLYDDITLGSGESIMVYTHTVNSVISVISKKENGTYTPLVKSTGHTNTNFCFVYTNNSFSDETLTLSIEAASQSMTIVKVSNNIASVDLFRYLINEYCQCYMLDGTPALMKVKDKVSIDNIDITNGYYIMSDGTRSAHSSGYISEEVLLRKGMVVSVKCYLDKRVCLMSYHVQGSFIPLIVPESTTGNSTELITIPYDGKYVFSSFNRLSINYVASINLDKQITDVTYRDFVLEAGNYITSTGILSPNSAGRISEQIPLLKGEKIKIKGFGRNVVCAISQYIDGKNIPLVNYAGSSSSWQELEYVSDNNIIVRICALTNYPLIVIETQAKEQLLTTRKELVSLQKSFNDNIDQQYTDNILAMYDNITCLGDSLTFSQVFTGSNTNRQAKKPWGEIVGDICGNTVEIIATPGYNATTWWNNYSDRLVAKENNIYLVYLCNNGELTDTIDTDCPPDVPMENWANTNTGNLCRILQTIYNLGDKAILIKRREWDTDHVEPNIVLDKFGVRFNFPVLDNTYFSGACYHTANGYVNNVHYNDLGYCMFANYIIKKTGKLSETMLSRLIS